MSRPMCLPVFLWLVSVGAAAEEPVPIRMWRDVTGKFEVRATLVEARYDKEAKGTLITLKKEDGKTIAVPLRRLSEEDRDFVLRVGRARAGDKPPAKPTAEKPVHEPDRAKPVKPGPKDKGAGQTVYAETYPVHQLIAAGAPADQQVAQIIGTITSTIAPTTWDAKRGPGSIQATSVDGKPALIVTHRGEVHRSIAELLSQLQPRPTGKRR